MAGKMYEDSIQELNNLIGELDEFQREHELKMKQKKDHEKPIELSKSTLLNGLNDFMTRSTIPDVQDVYTNFDKLSICSGDRNPNLSSTQSINSNDLTFSDISSTHHQSNGELNGSFNGNGISIQNGSNGIDDINHLNKVYDIQLIHEKNNVPDSYLKEHTEVVVLRRKDSLTDLNGENGDKQCNGNKNELERVSSFRCTSFTRPDRDSLTFSNKSTTNNGLTINDTVINQNDNHMDIRCKPHISPRPASLSGLFKYAHIFHFFYFKLIYILILIFIFFLWLHLFSILFVNAIIKKF